MKKLLSILCLQLIVIPCFSQINNGEKPYSFKNKINAVKVENNNQEKIILPPLDLNKLKKEDVEDEANGIPPRFGFPHKVNIDLSNSGKWLTLENGDRIWKLEIHCPSAKSINLLYDEYWLPDNAEFYIYNSSKTHYLGGYTKANNKGPKQKPGKFGTGLVYGSKIILEYYEPKEVMGKGIISINYVVHGYRYIDILNELEALESFGSSGACQVNVNCSPEGDEWQDEKTSVALVLVSGTRWCTGSLINNVRQNGIPYFLTANHCLSGWAVSDPLDAITNPDGSDWSFYWNYESPGCNNGTDFTPPSTSGATLVANNSASDFALFILTESPYDLSPQRQLYFNGWERNNPSQGGVGIHHPAGDIKKIATHDTVPWSYGNYWRLYWAETPNGFSVTEGGSSGSPLYNSNNRVIGQLFGGSSINCSDPANDVAVYGKISVSWNNSTDSRRRLRDWLDPGNTNTMSLDGTFCTTTEYITNTIFDSDETIHGCTINLQNVKVRNGANLTLVAANDVIINGEFEVELGSELETR